MTQNATQKPATTNTKPAAKPAAQKPAAESKPKAQTKKPAAKAKKPAEPKAPPIMKIGTGKVEKGVPLASIIADATKMQAREKLSEPKVKEYATLMKDGIKFPPIEVFKDGDKYVLADGFHRLHAMVKNGDVTCNVKVFPGGTKEALFHALGANSSHGLARSNNDKKKAVHTFLTHPEFSKYSDRDIARHIGVSNVMVSKYRKSLRRSAGEETDTGGKGSKGGRLRAELDEVQQAALDESLSKIRNEVVACAKKLGDREQDFLRRLFNAEIKLTVNDTTMGTAEKKRELHPNNQAKKDAAKK